MNREELLEYANYLCDEGIKKNENAFETDCKILEFLFDNCEITVPEENRFFISINCDGIQRQIIERRASKIQFNQEEETFRYGEETLAYTGFYDFSHTSAHWKSVVNYGIAGLKDKIVQLLDNKTASSKAQKFYSQVLSVYLAALRFIKRAAESAYMFGKTEMGDGLKNLSKQAPSSLYEATQTIIIYYVLQHMFEGTYLRTLGRLDSLLYPYYQKEEKSYANQLLLDFVKEIDRLKAPSNIPFMIGGSDENGICSVNELSYLFISIYQNAQTNNTKLHLLCSKTMPEDLISFALDGVRHGNNSIVFMSDEKIIESLLKLGEEHTDAVNYHVVGCYECGGDNETTCSCNARVNLVKALECTINNGRDLINNKKIGLENKKAFQTFEELFSAFQKQVAYFCRCAMNITDRYESHIAQLHSAPILSVTYPFTLEKAGDIYCDHAAKYNNSSLNAIGLGTVVDALATMRKLIFEEKKLTLSQMVDILKNNWEGNESLRLWIKNKGPKFGTGDTRIDLLAKEIVDNLSETVNKKPNKKTGIYRLGLFSIDWRWEFGKKTAASADGRLLGDTLSQNTSASFGADREGATMHLSSVAQIDCSNTPNGAIADIDLHSSAVKGQNGLTALTSSLKAYFEMGGFAVHYNVLDTETLKKAKQNPDAYPNLQVRLCGWNVLFSSLSEKEKDEFIARSIRQV